MSKVAHRLSEKSRTGDVAITENITFEGLLLSNNVLNGLKNAGFERPSPIQLKAIPLGRCGLDLIVQAKSGTGKTCVFSVISLESINLDTSATQVLVLAPTREIAVQIWEVINSIGSAMKGLQCHTFIGGLPLHEDRMKLRKCHIAVGSPGRVKQLIEGGSLSTSSIRLFVLDEADKLLEEGFQEQINWIYSSLPENKQMLALSATYPEYLAQHLTAYMRNPTFLRLNITDPALLGIRQFYQTVPYHPMSHLMFEEKVKALKNILSSISFQQCLVFSNLQTRAENLADQLTSQGWPTACIAGCLDQKQRNEAMAKLKTYKCRILISTDLTSRGIDADKVNMVINLDIPKDHETYLHRIGRAGRFGSFGIGISLVSEGQERLDLTSLEKRCNTIINPLPDPIPSDLARPDAPIYLDDVVSSEVLNTDSTHLTTGLKTKTSDQNGGENGEQLGAAMTNGNSESLVKSHEKEETNQATKNGLGDHTAVQTNGTKGADDTDSEMGIETDDRFRGKDTTAKANDEDIEVFVKVKGKKGSKKVIVNSSESKTGVTEHGDASSRVMERNLPNDYTENTREINDSGLKHGKPSLEQNVGNGLKDKFNHKSLTNNCERWFIKEKSNVEEKERLVETDDMLESFHKSGQANKTEKVAIVNELKANETGTNDQNNSLPKPTINNDSANENQRPGFNDKAPSPKPVNVPLVGLRNLVRNQGLKSTSSISEGIEEVDLTKVYKLTTGFRNLETTTDYETAKESLKSFKENVDRSDKPVFEIPKVDLSESEESFKLKRNIAKILEHLNDQGNLGPTQFVPQADTDLVETEIQTGPKEIDSPVEIETLDEMIDEGNKTEGTVKLENKTEPETKIEPVVEVKVEMQKHQQTIKQIPKGQKPLVVPAKNKNVPNKIGYTGKFAIAHILQQQREIGDKNVEKGGDKELDNGDLVDENAPAEGIKQKMSEFDRNDESDGNMVEKELDGTLLYGRAGGSPEMMKNKKRENVGFERENASGTENKTDYNVEELDDDLDGSEISESESEETETTDSSKDDTDESNVKPKKSDAKVEKLNEVVEEADDDSDITSSESDFDEISESTDSDESIKDRNEQLKHMESGVRIDGNEYYSGASGFSEDIEQKIRRNGKHKSGHKTYSMKDRKMFKDREKDKTTRAESQNRGSNQENTDAVSEWYRQCAAYYNSGQCQNHKPPFPYSLPSAYNYGPMPYGPYSWPYMMQTPYHQQQYYPQPLVHPAYYQSFHPTHHQDHQSLHQGRQSHHQNHQSNQQNHQSSHQNHQSLHQNHQSLHQNHQSLHQNHQSLHQNHQSLHQNHRQNQRANPNQQNMADEFQWQSQYVKQMCGLNDRMEGKENKEKEKKLQKIKH